ncbi:hypothetical protein K1T35_34940 [Pseudonocardia sp. DSM 110487]|jgi:hypothetical protein|uniref:hypothetical protein n=1 Tax=Pseudonocardia sp. DSM 110487 TaxID=2865833 RepID=UPI001C6984BD|nr:hypothetical protein [Pseudonocardia sp. DSM 110487]QYN33639.1 hypothetical protein K1T35_34940 [Pseudonocardia sp. DSM 110487]
MSAPLRVLFCIGINQNFFDLPTGQGGAVWKATVQLLDEIEAMAGVRVLGTIDDDAHMVGPSDGWPWTAYVLADVDTQETVKAVCNLFRTIPVGEHSLWRYAKVEARIGRPLVVRDDVEIEATS